VEVFAEDHDLCKPQVASSTSDQSFKQHNPALSIHPNCPHQDHHMRAFQRLLATTSSSPGRAVPLSLLPPIPLYRRVLRAQRRLPGDMRVLGDEYIKSEFRAHRNIENPLHIVSYSAFNDVSHTHSSCRLVSSLNGSCMHRKLRAMNGEKTVLINIHLRE
jgi:hypothetical protein